MITSFFLFLLLQRSISFSSSRWAGYIARSLTCSNNVAFHTRVVCCWKVACGVGARQHNNNYTHFPTYKLVKIRRSAFTLQLMATFNKRSSLSLDIPPQHILLHNAYDQSYISFFLFFLNSSPQRFDTWYKIIIIIHIIWLLLIAQEWNAEIYVHCKQSAFSNILRMHKYTIYFRSVEHKSHIYRHCYAWEWRFHTATVLFSTITRWVVHILMRIKKRKTANTLTPLLPRETCNYEKLVQRWMCMFCLSNLARFFSLHLLTIYIIPTNVV